MLPCPRKKKKKKGFLPACAVICKLFVTFCHSRDQYLPRCQGGSSICCLFSWRVCQKYQCGAAPGGGDALDMDKWIFSAPKASLVTLVLVQKAARALPGWSGTRRGSPRELGACLGAEHCSSSSAGWLIHRKPVIIPELPPGLLSMCWCLAVSAAYVLPVPAHPRAFLGLQGELCSVQVMGWQCHSNSRLWVPWLAEQHLLIKDISVFISRCSLGSFGFGTRGVAGNPRSAAPSALLRAIPWWTHPSESPEGGTRVPLGLMNPLYLCL